VLGEVKLEVLAPDAPHAKIAVTVNGELSERNLPPACRLVGKAWNAQHTSSAVSTASNLIQLAVKSNPATWNIRKKSMLRCF
jgi:hypothetical protein